MIGGSGAGKPRMSDRITALLQRGPEEIEALSGKEINGLIHELRVHQEELETQNEELRRAHRELEKIRQRYARLFDHAPVGYLTIDRSGIIIQANQTFADMVDIGLPDLHHKAFSTFVDPADRDVFLARFKAFFKSPGGKRMDVGITGRGGIFFHARLEGRVESLQESPAGRGSPHVHLLLIVSDISEQKAAEEALRRSSAQTARMLESISDAFFSLDEGLVVTYFNKAAERILGKSREEVVGRELFTVFHQARGSIFETRYRQALAEKAFITFETYFDRPPYENWYEVRVYPQDEGISVYFQVITERKRAEEERTRLEGQLRHAQKMEAVGRLAAGVAHDFNNMLSPILGYSEMIIEDLHATDPRHAHAAEIHRAAQRSRDLVRQLLAFSRKQVLEMKILDLGKLIHDFQRMLRRAIRENIEIHLHIDPEAGNIRGDVSQVEQVIMNLAVNAQDAMPGGGILTIETARAELDRSYAETHPGVAPGAHVMLAISDSGHGMDTETRDRVFEPFFTTKEKSRGTGLGLATVYGIVKQHGGNIYAYSEPGRGAIFKIFFPSVGQEAPEGTAAETESGDLSGTETIMVVEDDEMVLRMIRTVLAKKGYRVLGAADGRQCLEVLSAHPGEVDLLLTDVIMPDMNGRVLYERMSEAYPDVKVLFMSGYTDNVIAHHGILDAGVKFIPKPFSMNALAEKVREVLES